MAVIADFKRKFESEKIKFAQELIDARSSASILSFHRRIIDKMEEQVVVNTLSNEAIMKYVSPDEWYLKIATEIDEADKKLEQLKALKLQEFFLFAQQQISKVSSGSDYEVKDEQNGLAYLVLHDDRYLKKVVSSIMSEMQLWLVNHVPDEKFYKQKIEIIYYDFLKERQDLIALLKITNELSVGVEQSIIPIDRPMHVEVAEFAMALIPYVGNAVALYEAYNGKDLFGYKLTVTERSILAATAILPIAGRFVKAGKALYTATRMQKLYGREVAVWSRTIGAGERISKNARFYQAFNKAEPKIRVGQKLDAVLSTEIESTLKTSRFTGSGASEISLIVPSSTKILYDKIVTKYPFFASLDELVMQRIIQKKNADHIKGQILEDLLENKICSWLRETSSAGRNALGLNVTGQLEFVPGHLVRDLKGRQITDGIIIKKIGTKAEVIAIFEAKAGQSASRELRITSTTLSDLSQADRKELRAYAKDVYEELSEEARLQGTSFTKTIEDIEKEIILSEKGGQVRRDMERLHDSTIKIAGVETEIIVTPQKTKIFGVVPKDVRVGTMEQELKSLGYKFEVLGIDVTQSDLQKLAKEILDSSL